MSWRFVDTYNVLQAGHWKSLNTSMTTGAFFEPSASCGSRSGIEAAVCGIECGCAAVRGRIEKLMATVVTATAHARARIPVPDNLARRFTTTLRLMDS